MITVAETKKIRILGNKTSRRFRRGIYILYCFAGNAGKKFIKILAIIEGSLIIEPLTVR